MVLGKSSKNKQLRRVLFCLSRVSFGWFSPNYYIPLSPLAKKIRRFWLADAKFQQSTINWPFTILLRFVNFLTSVCLLSYFVLIVKSIMNNQQVIINCYYHETLIIMSALTLGNPCLRGLKVIFMHSETSMLYACGVSMST